MKIKLNTGIETYIDKKGFVSVGYNRRILNPNPIFKAPIGVNVSKGYVPCHKPHINKWFDKFKSINNI